MHDTTQIMSRGEGKLGLFMVNAELLLMNK